MPWDAIYRAFLLWFLKDFQHGVAMILNFYYEMHHLQRGIHTSMICLDSKKYWNELMDNQTSGSKTIQGPLSIPDLSSSCLLLLLSQLGSGFCVCCFSYCFTHTCFSKQTIVCITQIYIYINIMGCMEQNIGELRKIFEHSSIHSFTINGSLFYICNYFIISKCF